MQPTRDSFIATRYEISEKFSEQVHKKISHFRAQILLILEEQMSMKKAGDHGRKVVSH